MMMKDEVVEINDKSRMIYSVNSPHDWTIEKNATGLFPCVVSAKSLSERIYRPSEYSVRICFVLLVFGNLCSTSLGALSVFTL